jgi:hypothetical protein
VVESVCAGEANIWQWKWRLIPKLFAPSSGNHREPMVTGIHPETAAGSHHATCDRVHHSSRAPVNSHVHHSSRAPINSSSANIRRDMRYYVQIKAIRWLTL